MSDTPETLAAVLAEMRELADHRAADAGGERPAIELLRSYADRIEAAAERERDEDRQLAAIAESDEAFARCARCDRPERVPGNAAAMRAALNQLRDWALLDINENAIRSDEPNYKKLVDGIVEITNAALAAPARNCDRFATAEEAIQTYAAKCDGDDHPDFGMFGYWLFAPAEGGAK